MFSEFDEQDKAVPMPKEELMALLLAGSEDQGGDGGDSGVFDPGDDTITLHK
jgi:hypothetical protein